MEPIEAPAIQREVQRLMGRCLLRLQQYERLMKTMLASHELAGPMDELEGRLASQAEAQANKTLGQLANALFETHVVPEGFERDLLPESTTPNDRISIAISARVTMDPESLAKAKSAMADLVKLRNELVHHFIDRFDLWTEAGCQAGITHLTDAYRRIDARYEELRSWAKGIAAARNLASEFTTSEAYSEWLMKSMAPGSTFDWPATGIVSALRQASKELQVQGWTPLDAAVAWIQTHHPEQSPEKYGCRSWPHVLNESRLFELTYRSGSSPDDATRKQGWFRASRGS